MNTAQSLWIGTANVPPPPETLIEWTGPHGEVIRGFFVKGKYEEYPKPDKPKPPYQPSLWRYVV